MAESVEVRPVTDDNREQFYDLYNLLCPQGVPKIISKAIPATFYVRLAFVKSRPVGLICIDTDCRFEDNSIPEASPYLLFLGVKPMFRMQGIGSRLLNTSVNDLSADGHSAIYLHVQKDNEPAISIYRQHKFKHIATIPHYYRRMECEDAWIMMCNLKC
ncbi:unnamed protein product [Bursaphelenchus xylophilus]|uniref:N-terminal methionine N(alpha)-acetyltransferase NatE n=1 Tax=Bursaphelenchus xylophilus TaxID=6326 RepID=A0A1I7SDZ1_BURXY|nr:unnamed protein product [Bursaphelenchus xylophilus]CAG9100381.1 unnamed protein product [Bursaphelenchus xylophilus]